MFAIIQDSGHQVRVESGLELAIDFRADCLPGSKLTFDKVLLANGGGASVLGRPFISGATVQAEVIGAVKAPKLEIQKFRRRKKERRHTGHRQPYTMVQVTSINVPGLQIVAKDEQVAAKS